ncbi:SDR family oxidoreductase [Flagellimonas lutimaris]|uniref:SDR family oxidoreductase n=1 Tax=Flagellimonas lutimaris TaxID=475082 RepID=A0A3A1NGV1_9FLAO|nr:SDR family oxidoreductase [Allomuricauda lutimaris]RIV36682.1 SDR family oxidoreductase [Allomuricauda lutimaris]
MMKNKKIIVTGGSSGIGKETAKKLIEKGAQVVITGRDENKLKDVAAQIGAIPLLFDISELASIPEKTNQAIRLLNGNIDVLINNAGIGKFPMLGEITQEDLEEVYHTNVFGLALLTQEVIPYFKKQGYGDIVNIGSTASLKGFSRGSVYAASKFALRGMTQSWQAELRKFNIRVSLVNPSEVTTAFADITRKERKEETNKLGPKDISHTIVTGLELREKGFVPEVTIWATNPF